MLQEFYSYIQLSKNFEIHLILPVSLLLAVKSIWDHCFLLRHTSSLSRVNVCFFKIHINLNFRLLHAAKSKSGSVCVLHKLKVCFFHSAQLPLLQRQGLSQVKLNVKLVSTALFLSPRTRVALTHDVCELRQH